MEGKIPLLVFTCVVVYVCTLTTGCGSRITQKRSTVRYSSENRQISTLYSIQVKHGEPGSVGLFQPTP